MNSLRVPNQFKLYPQIIECQYSDVCIDKAADLGYTLQGIMGANAGTINLIK